MYFWTAASSEKDQGSMNLASNTAPVPATIPSRVAAIQGIAECLTRRWTSSTVRPVLRSYQVRLRSSVALPSCTIRLPDRFSWPTSPRFSCQRPDEGYFVAAHNDPGVRLSYKAAPSSRIGQLCSLMVHVSRLLVGKCRWLPTYSIDPVVNRKYCMNIKCLAQ
jgi:hypothetical protein